MGRETAKKKGKKKSEEAALEVVEKKWVQFKQFKEQELEQLKELTLVHKEKNKLIKEKTEAKKMKLYLQLREEEHLDDQNKKLLEKLSVSCLKLISIKYLFVFGQNCQCCLVFSVCFNNLQCCVVLSVCFNNLQCCLVLSVCFNNC